MTWLFIAENPKKSIKIVELINDFSKVIGYKVNQKLYCSTHKLENKI